MHYAYGRHCLPRGNHCLGLHVAPITDLYQALEKQVHASQVLKFKFKHFSRNSQVQVAHYQTSLTLITDQFFTVYNQIKITNQTTDEIIYFAMSIRKQVKLQGEAARSTELRCCCCSRVQFLKFQKVIKKPTVMQLQNLALLGRDRR